MQSQPSQDRITAIVRKHAHDVRNYINSLDLEASFVEELVTDPEVIESARRMRSQLRQLEVVVKSLSVKFTEPRPLPLTAPDLLQLWKYQVEQLEERSGTIEWSSVPPSFAVMLDPGIITLVLRELVIEAWGRSRGITASVRANSQQVTAELIWPCSSEPIASSGEHERLVSANGGELRRSYDASTKVASLTLNFPVTAD